ncbi:hypothetical protein EVAR_21340_1 [Eumeta japonica]|uniref:Uncharacterized protein n=1 Tax=Eumeta variegata TaxID=151549 RepID=A0A4C1ZS41_EUMVA|nr:hypothetical protein EVAR_21340_1 [Eumeta japonica]
MSSPLRIQRTVSSPVTTAARDLYQMVSNYRSGDGLRRYDVGFVVANRQLFSRRLTVPRAIWPALRLVRLRAWSMTDV